MSSRGIPALSSAALLLPVALILIAALSAWPVATDGGQAQTPVTAQVATGAGGSLSRISKSTDGGSLGECSDCDVEAKQVSSSPTAAASPVVSPTATVSPVPTLTTTPSPYHPAFAVDARAVAILEAPCGALLYGKSEHDRLPPASLTKIMTALTAIDHVNLADFVDVELSAKELKQRTRSSVMGLEPGITVTVEDLLYGLFLPSGNDAAIVLAEHVSGDVGTFVDLMNQKAAELGLHDSSFKNPHGLDAGGQRSSAYDMAVAGMAMMKNPTLAAISSAPSYVLDGGLTLVNGNRLLNVYPGAYGVKIGYTNAAHYTIVAAAERGGRDLYAAVLGSDDLYNETGRLLDWAFAETPGSCQG